MKNFIYFNSIRKDPLKVKIINDGIRKKLVQPFDDWLIIKLRHLYYGGIPGSIYMYLFPSLTTNTGDKVQLLSYAFEDLDFVIIHAKVNSVNNHVSTNELTKLKSNTWLEVTRDGRVWVYDLFSLMKFDRDLYYKLENPVVEREITSKQIQSSYEYHEDAENFKNIGDELILPMLLPNLEKRICSSAYCDYLTAELIRFKREINYEHIEQELEEEKRLKGIK